MGTQLCGRVKRNRAVAVAPENQAGSIQMATQRAAQTGHILMPRAEQPKQVQDRSRRAEVVAIRPQELQSIAALRTRHAAQAHHLHPLREPRL